jgi:hypothetical protein
VTFPYHLPKEPGNTTRFDCVGHNGTYQTYSVPVGATALLILLVSAGGSGGAGASGAEGTPRGGGGGGGAGGVVRGFFPTLLLPSMLFISIPKGGNIWQSAVVGFQPNPANLLLAAGYGGAGGAGTSLVPGIAGTSGFASSPLFQSLGVTTGLNGPTGVAGGAIAGAVGVSQTYGGNVITQGGAGGAGTTSANFAGGIFNGAGLCPSIPGGLADGGNGNPGFELWLPPTFSGGTGGGSSNAGPGGRGGDGARGCGGGGGGGGTTGGAGGRGGDGVAFITALY